MNSACTFGSWHPLAAEKLMALDMNMAEDDDMSVFQFGILRIRRPDKLLCGFNFFGYWGGGSSAGGSDNPGAFNQAVFIECNKQFSFAMNINSSVCLWSEEAVSQVASVASWLLFWAGKKTKQRQKQKQKQKLWLAARIHVFLCH